MGMPNYREARVWEAPNASSKVLDNSQPAMAESSSGRALSAPLLGM
jgi:hypothetical protein